MLGTCKVIVCLDKHREGLTISLTSRCAGISGPHQDRACGMPSSKASLPRLCCLHLPSAICRCSRPALGLFAVSHISTGLHKPTRFSRESGMDMYPKADKAPSLALALHEIQVLKPNRSGWPSIPHAYVQLCHACERFRLTSRCKVVVDSQASHPDA